MKSLSISKLSVVFCLFTMFAVVSGCDKAIDFTEQLKPLAPASDDANAGTWKPVVMTSVSQIAVPVPADITTDAYKAELAAVKDAQSKLTSERRKAIEYWSGGGILRWNQILRELVARYNLPPAPASDGTYPTPDAENPFADPGFPFANPPYAARAYSYVTVAQSDALKACWYYKYQYNRPAPYVTDSGIKSLMTASQLPSYPSEEAVMSGVTAELLKALFPAAVQEITMKAAEQRNAALWSGKATSSDIAAGLALGKSVAALFTARAAGDGMRNAIGNKTLWKGLEDNATSRGEIPWKSLDLPARPPMLPFFGQVKSWNMTPAQVVAERPVPPPSTSSAEMKSEVDEVKYFSTHLTRERLKIVHKWADGAGTYTPPGHWNDIAEEYIRDANMSEVRAARTFALLNMALHDAAVGCWESKYFYFNPRPTQLDPSIKTGTGIPNFPSYTSGHSTFSGAAATILSYLFPSGTTYFNQEANEASLSRLYGGIHYRIDTTNGLDHGNRIGGYTVLWAQGDGAN
ncbi:MAG: phosphatase PAP2 family protein [Cyclobacteriaceae bacterium]|nr:phosphatase PAP2 family protein [Cyclobacteriaceae bacterium]